MIYIHFYLDQEDITNAAENKQFSHTMVNQDTCYKYALYQVLLMHPVLTVHSPYEYLKPKSLILPKILLNLVPLPIW